MTFQVVKSKAKVDSSQQTVSAGSYADLYYVYVPGHSQVTTYFCGPATGLQTIDTWGSYGNVPGSDSSAKQYTLADDMHTTTSGTGVYYQRDGMNEYLPLSWYSTETIKNDSSSRSELRDLCIYDIGNSRPVVFLTIKNRLDYYAGTSSSGHYISGSAYYDYGSLSSDQVGLKDTHYNSTYFGYHVEDFDNVHEALYYYYQSRGVANFVW